MDPLFHGLFPEVLHGGDEGTVSTRVVEDEGVEGEDLRVGREEVSRGL